MDLAACDLESYQLARQLHMLPELYKVFVSQVMCYPLFYESLLPTVRSLVRVSLLSLYRRFNASAGSTGGLLLARRYQVDSIRLVLSFLDFPDHQTDRVNFVSHCITAAPLSQLELSPQLRGTAPTLSHSLGATPNSLTPQLSASGAAAAIEPPALSMPRALEDASSGAPSGSASSTTTPANRPTASAGGVVQEMMYKPLFYLRPTSATPHADSATPHFGATTHLYVRMVHPEQLNEESLNTYFGRYGQVDVTTLQRIPLQQYEQYLGDAVTAALHQLFPSAEVGDTLYVQDFIITVDSHQNALHAVRHAYCKELVCIALHDTEAGGGSNTHCLADVNNWMRRHACVWRLRVDSRVIATEASIGAGERATGAAAAEKQRKRARARQRRQERKMKRRSVLGITADELSGGSAKSSTLSLSREVARKDAGSSDRRRSGSSYSSSSTSDSDSAEDDQEGFVPDVVLDGFPYWTTEDQLKVLLQEYGTVAELRLSVDDLSGAFTGCVLVRMASVKEALTLSRAVHNTLYRGFCLTSGVVNERLEVVALEDGREVRRPCPPEQVPPDVTLNERVWV
ncbi:hypothetical protein JKF63_02717 [Porcisia hertigi]|uniref:RRM domain-containing protein n=1 Tax=Porcisia hertigi TaxID=2761500 RepID=A0A836L6F7_9TRYP|nr:hypothetical protein JKF63_02717 [Porcisia hertigi]